MSNSTESGCGSLVELLEWKNRDFALSGLLDGGCGEMRIAQCVAPDRSDGSDDVDDGLKPKTEI